MPLVLGEAVATIPILQLRKSVVGSRPAVNQQQHTSTDLASKGRAPEAALTLTAPRAEPAGSCSPMSRSSCELDYNDQHAPRFLPGPFQPRALGRLRRPAD